MRKMLFMLTTLLTMAVSAQAMSYKTARSEALFLTDKMGYELGLSDAQRNAVYEINFDYMMSLNNTADLYGTGWTRRNLDMSYVMSSAQYRLFRAAEYFFRPVYWKSGWRHSIYNRYTNRSHFYYGRPSAYTGYKGAHSWRSNGNKSWYKGKRYDSVRPTPPSVRHDNRQTNKNNGSWRNGKNGKSGKKDNGNGNRNDRNSHNNRHFGH